MIDKTWLEFLDQHHLLKIKNLKKNKLPYLLYQGLFEFLKDYDEKKLKPIEKKKNLLRHAEKQRKENEIQGHPQVLLLKYFIQRENFILDKIQDFFASNWHFDIVIKKEIDFYSQAQDMYLVFHDKISYRVIIFYQKRKETFFELKDFFKWLDIIFPAYFKIYYIERKDLF